MTPADSGRGRHADLDAPPTTPTPRAPAPDGDRAIPTATPVPTATPTPTVSSVIEVSLEARPYQWDFLAGPEIASDPQWPGKNRVTLRVGQTYRFDVFNGSPELDPPLPAHTFSGVAALGLSGGDFAPGEHLPPRTITITGAMVGSYTYSVSTLPAARAASTTRWGAGSSWSTRSARPFLPNPPPLPCGQSAWSFRSTTAVLLSVDTPPVAWMAEVMPGAE